MTEYIERHLVLCDERDCRECGRQNRIHVELPEDLQDREPFEQIDSFESGNDIDLFEIVPNGLYPKYIYRLDVPEVRVRESPTGPDSPNLVPFADPVRSGRCLLFRSNLLAHRLERWEIESGVMIFSPGTIIDSKLFRFSKDYDCQIIDFFYIELLSLIVI